ncbi:hypothetical protein BRE01_32450 [Brevibacillus reuszeri]|uniref:DUF4179 domain-containing protein n=1 Tax=Brevibacillus reuszeri TaxID=54915 RepID=A0A0K9YY90_9BACL|nr:DUF4179 domain-containing protein [Brevibacillus reuszeri]KNB73626.1 hypothetical protein ADS79_06715 [Brevibacillus reuszeri]MED1858568.1 DUF4179 domain-containing protein [Brevibacillus reuszeri]GED69543.1 hypothetical protein BRE01_32450 [Brevibacillus reuszeri]
MTKLDQHISQTLKKVADEQGIPSFEFPSERAALASRKRDSRFPGLLLFPTTAIIAFFLIITLGTQVSPSIAAYMKSLFTEKGADEGLQQAAQNGYSQAVGASATDQGITLEVMEVMADSVRINIVYRLVDQAGNVLSPDQLDSYDVEITDPNGESVQNSSSTSLRYEKEYGYLRISNKIETSDQKLILRLDTAQIGNTKGNWSVSVPFDITKSTAATTTFPLDNTYVTPQGLQIKLTGITHSPTATRLEYETSWTEEAFKKLEQVGEKLAEKIETTGIARYRSFDHNRAFRIEREKNGVKIGEVKPLSGGASGKKEGHLSHQDVYQPFIPGETYYLVLDSITKVEPFELSISFDPKKIDKQSAKATKDDNVFQISAYGIGKSDDEISRTEVTIDAYVQGMIPHIDSRFLLLTDEKGRTYRFKGASHDYFETDEKGRQHIQAILKVEEQLDPIPEKLTLNFYGIPKRYTNVNWRVPLPTSTVEDKTSTEAKK